MDVYVVILDSSDESALNTVASNVESMTNLALDVDYAKAEEVVSEAAEAIQDMRDRGDL